jgi:hypothetical protein
MSPPYDWARDGLGEQPLWLGLADRDIDLGLQRVRAFQRFERGALWISIPERAEWEIARDVRVSQFFLVAAESGKPTAFLPLEMFGPVGRSVDGPVTLEITP